ncbi:MAG: FAD synthetase family protein [Caldisericia bacterium]|nr:FAD synthetase family protein [Caldisericia bacterium]
MKVFKDFEILKEPIALSIGTYDAIHLGHLEIIKKMKEKSLKTCIISFYPPPFIFFGIEKNVLFTQEEKIKIFEELELDFLFIINFDEKIKNLKSEDFIKILTSNLNIKYLIVGKNFRFGKDKDGDKEKLDKFSKKYNFILELIEEKKIGKEKISSSKIRHLIRIGDIDSANKILYKNYFVFIKNKNDKLEVDSLKLLPPDGNYKVKINKKDMILEIKNRKLILKENVDIEQPIIEFLNKLG